MMLGDWAEDAACIGKTHLFLPTTGNSAVAKNLAAAAEARALLICAKCPVRTECLEHAVREREFHGTWGGTTEAERKKLIRADRAGERVQHKQVCDGCFESFTAARIQRFCSLECSARARRPAGGVCAPSARA